MYNKDGKVDDQLEWQAIVKAKKIDMTNEKWLNNGKLNLILIKIVIAVERVGSKALMRLRI